VSDELAFASALELAAQLRAGTVRPSSSSSSLDRIERLDPKLNSYVTVDAEARAAARTVRPDHSAASRSRSRI
jgi:Asp-tRNA(Asn)/Glu-tRNA(Gln) amidotransferase A subunit family amidase